MWSGLINGAVRDLLSNLDFNCECDQEHHGLCR